MRTKSLLLLVMALGCGLIAAVGINQIMARPSTDGETVSIVVAKREILKGDLIKPDDIRLQEWRKDALPEGAIDKIEVLQDKRVKSTIILGEPLLAGKLIDGKGDAVEIPAGMKAVTVKVDKVSASGLIKPGDNVDVLVHAEANQQRGIMQTTTQRLLENVKVLAVDDVVERPAPGEPPISATTVSLLVTPKDAMRVTLASEVGTIRLIMRSIKDQSGEDDAIDSGVSISELFRGGSSGDSTPKSGGSGGGLLASAGILPLPKTGGPSLGDEVAKGVNSFADLLSEIKKARDVGIPDEKKSYKVMLILGNEAQEVEFNGESRLGQVVGSTGGSGGVGASAGLPPTPALDSRITPPAGLVPEVAPASETVHGWMDGLSESLSREV